MKTKDKTEKELKQYTQVKKWVNYGYYGSSIITIISAIIFLAFVVIKKPIALYANNYIFIINMLYFIVLFIVQKFFSIKLKKDISL